MKRITPPKPLEKEVEAACDRLMGSLGFQIVRFSQPRATRQTPGIPDRRYRHPARGIVFWFECKRPGGKQSPAQKEFQQWEEACGETVVVGGIDELTAYLASLGLIREVRPGLWQPVRPARVA